MPFRADASGATPFRAISHRSSWPLLETSLTSAFINAGSLSDSLSWRNASAASSCRASASSFGMSHRLVVATRGGRLAAILHDLLQLGLADHRARADFSSA